MVPTHFGLIWKSHIQWFILLKPNSGLHPAKSNYQRITQQSIQRLLAYSTYQLCQVEGKWAARKQPFLAVKPWFHGIVSWGTGSHLTPVHCYFVTLGMLSTGPSYTLQREAGTCCPTILDSKCLQDFCIPPNTEVSWNRGIPKSSIYGWIFPEINHLAIGVPPI